MRTSSSILSGATIRLPLTTKQIEDAQAIGRIIADGFSEKYIDLMQDVSKKCSEILSKQIEDFLKLTADEQEFLEITCSFTAERKMARK